MFRRFFAAVRSLIPDRHRHDWVVRPIEHDPRPPKRYWQDRVCKDCPRRERRKWVAGPKQGDARSLYPDPFSGWEPVKRAG